ncbi:MAG: hypothetical protein AB1403_01375 [Candidatus Riflebacteria bacterium]
MKEKCEQFVMWLHDHESGAAIEKSQQIHLNECSSCRELFSRQEKLFGQLKSSITLSDQKRSGVEKVLMQRLFADNSDTAGFFERLFQSFAIRRLALPTAVVLIAVAWFLFNNGSLPGEIIISGFSTIMVDGRKIQANETKVCLKEKETVSLVSGQIKLNWSDQEMIDITGRLEFVPEAGSLKVSQGRARIKFLPSARGYLVETSLLKIEVVGTEIELEVSDTISSMSVLHGKVRWAVEAQGKQGEAQAGSRITVRNSSSGPYIIEDSMVTEPQSKSSDQKEDGILVEKTGETWKMK